MSSGSCLRVCLEFVGRVCWSSVELLEFVDGLIEVLP